MTDLTEAGAVTRAEPAFAEPVMADVDARVAWLELVVDALIAEVGRHVSLRMELPEKPADSSTRPEEKEPA